MPGKRRGDTQSATSQLQSEWIKKCLSNNFLLVNLLNALVLSEASTIKIDRRLWESGEADYRLVPNLIAGSRSACNRRRHATGARPRPSGFGANETHGRAPTPGPPRRDQPAFDLSKQWLISP